MDLIHFDLEVSHVSPLQVIEAQSSYIIWEGFEPVSPEIRDRGFLRGGGVSMTTCVSDLCPFWLDKVSQEVVWLDLCSGELILERGDGSIDSGGDGLIPPQKNIAGASNTGRLQIQQAFLGETGFLDSF